ncbi:MAG: FtsW/RodA/SpoVE family cell cycle protein [Pseudobutyrivibrio sp.]|nr:FtsW/RodA/SpoVE family cell cycle protein [Pseudobutyrivibrio sp.]
MVNVVTSLSRITIMAFVMLFAIVDIVFLFDRKIKEGLQSILLTIQAVMIVLFMINGAVVLYLNTQDFLIILLTAGELLLYLFISIVLNKICIPTSKPLINNVLMLLSFSFITLERLKIASACRQFAFAIISLIIASAVVYFLENFGRVTEYATVYLVIGLLLLLIVSVAGSVQYGAKLSLSFGNISVQPSEFVKITFLFFMGAVIAKYRDVKGFLIASVGAALHVLILVISKDLGTGLIFLVAYVFLIFISYKNYIVLFTELGVAAVGATLAYNMFPHIQTRFIAWSDPLSVIDDQGYQISQSLFAIGTGGWIGSGLCNGMPTKIPVVTKDFIFAAISEEMGAIVGLCLIVIVLCTFFMIFNAAYDLNNSFYMLVINGIGIIFATQALLNIGGVIKFIPSTGVTLPFVSYGGSSLLSMFICIFIIEAAEDFSISIEKENRKREIRTRKKENRTRYEKTRRYE